MGASLRVLFDPVNWGVGGEKNLFLYKLISGLMDVSLGKNHPYIMNKTTLCHLLGWVIIALVIFTLVGRKVPVSDVVVVSSTDTVFIRDTVRLSVPEQVLKTVSLVRYDTLVLYDTVFVKLPIESKEYRTDQFYALVEGYNPRLSYIEVYPQTKIVTRQVSLPPSRFSHGVNLGGGVIYGTKGLDLGFYVGYGLTFKF